MAQCYPQLPSHRSAQWEAQEKASGRFRDCKLTPQLKMLTLVAAVFSNTFQSSDSDEIQVLENIPLLAVWQWGQCFCKSWAVFGTKQVRGSLSAQGCSCPWLHETCCGSMGGLAGGRRGQAGGHPSTQNLFSLL